MSLYLLIQKHACLRSREGVWLFQSHAYQSFVSAVIVDEADCILEWLVRILNYLQTLDFNSMLYVILLKFCFILFRGNEFRTDYSQLGMLSAFFPNAPMIALTATANLMDRVQIKHSLNIKDSVDVIGNPDRRNIFYSKELRDSDELVSYEMILKPIAKKLIKLKMNYPLTIIHLPLRWCGFAYKLFDRVLAKAQYYPDDTNPIPKKRLFAQYHAPKTSAMKEMILAQMTSESSIIRIVFATVAIGMGVDIPNIREVIHIGPPSSVQQYFQETGQLAVMVCHPKHFFITITETLQRTDMSEKI